MKTAFATLALAASASAFVAPAPKSAATTTQLAEFANGLVGGESVEPMFIGETGSKNFDPAGLSEVRFVRWHDDSNIVVLVLF
jgi:hypothetical protein